MPHTADKMQTMREHVFVFDSATLSNFYLIGAQDVLLRRYKRRMVIPWEVFDEVSSGVMRSPRLKLFAGHVAAKNIKVATLSRKEQALYLSLIESLGKGEAACLAMARRRAWTVATDDKAARRECTALNVAYTGIIGILKVCCMDNQIPVETADYMLQMMVDEGFYSPVRSISGIL